MTRPSPRETYLALRQLGRRFPVAAARALWTQMEKRRLREETRQPTPMVLRMPCVPQNLLTQLGDRYRDFVVITQHSVTADQQWAVYHTPTKAKRTFTLSHVAAMMMPYADLIPWLGQQVREAADSILETINVRTM